MLDIAFFLLDQQGCGVNSGRVKKESTVRRTSTVLCTQRRRTASRTVLVLAPIGKAVDYNTILLGKL
jgi:hypothetical protein